TATTEIYTTTDTLSLHDALPIFRVASSGPFLTSRIRRMMPRASNGIILRIQIGRAHVLTPVTGCYLVCRLLLEKKKNNILIFFFRFFHFMKNTRLSDHIYG